MPVAKQRVEVSHIHFWDSPWSDRFGVSSLERRDSLTSTIIFFSSRSLNHGSQFSEGRFYVCFGGRRCPKHADWSTRNRVTRTRSRDIPVFEEQIIMRRGCPTDRNLPHPLVVGNRRVPHKITLVATPPYFSLTVVAVTAKLEGFFWFLWSWRSWAVHRGNITAQSSNSFRSKKVISPY